MKKCMTRWEEFICPSHLAVIYSATSAPVNLTNVNNALEYPPG
jgi:hypothetical protein